MKSEISLQTSIFHARQNGNRARHYANASVHMYLNVLASSWRICLLLTHNDGTDQTDQRFCFRYIDSKDPIRF